MIPHYRPTIGPVHAAVTWLSPLAAPDVAALESSYRREFDVPDAVVLPSVRAGILMLLQAFAGPETVVVGPAYTCMVVHEAMVLSGARARYVDPEPGSYLVSSRCLAREARPGACLVTSEMYGLPFDAEFFASTARLEPALRIFDMAMGIPDRHRLAWMESRDVALVSFGIGKSLCAGGGAIAFFTDPALAREIRQRRAAASKPMRFADRLRNDLHVLASVGIRTRLTCGLRNAGEALRDSTPDLAARSGSAKGAQVAGRLGPEWTKTMTPLERKLAAGNLRRCRASARLRHDQATAYLDCLEQEGVRCGISREQLPQSHFPVRVPAGARYRIAQDLRRHGIEVGYEFPFSGVIVRSEHPGAEAIASEIMTLPLGEYLSFEEIRRVCRLVAQALRTAPAPTESPASPALS